MPPLRPSQTCPRVHAAAPLCGARHDSFELRSFALGIVWSPAQRLSVTCQRIAHSHRLAQLDRSTRLTRLGSIRALAAMHASVSPRSLLLALGAVSAGASERCARAADGRRARPSASSRILIGGLTPTVSAQTIYDVISATSSVQVFCAMSAVARPS